MEQNVREFSQIFSEIFGSATALIAAGGVKSDRFQSLEEELNYKKWV